MIRAGLAAAFAVLAVAASIGGASAQQQSSLGAESTVLGYVDALRGPDTQRAYRLLTPAQQHYFGDERNYASNYTSTSYRIVAYSLARKLTRSPDLVEIDVEQTASYEDVTLGRVTTVKSVEPYFALRSNGAWGVKEIYQPWKSYAPRTSASGGGVDATVDRVEFFDRRIRIVCTLRNLGGKAVQVLPLLRSTLTMAGSTVAALNAADFPLNDQQMFVGARIYPLHQLVGYINFPLQSRHDRDLKATLVIGPVVQDGAHGPSSVTIGPIDLPKL